VDSETDSNPNLVCKGVTKQVIKLVKPHQLPSQDSGSAGFASPEGEPLKCVFASESFNNNFTLKPYTLYTLETPLSI